jgi:hypothetical protein
VGVIKFFGDKARLLRNKLLVGFGNSEISSSAGAPTHDAPLGSIHLGTNGIFYFKSSTTVSGWNSVPFNTQPTNTKKLVFNQTGINIPEFVALAWQTNGTVRRFDTTTDTLKDFADNCS